MNGVYQVKMERLKHLHGKANNIVRQFQIFSIRHCANFNKIYGDLLCGAIPIQDSSIKDELIDELELYEAMPMQYSSLKDELVLRRSSSKIQDSSLKDELVLRCFFSKIQDSSLKDELVLRHSPSKFIDGNCNISLICVFFLLINASFLMTMCFFQLYTKCDPTM